MTERPSSQPDIMPGDVWCIDGDNWRVVGPKHDDGQWPMSGPLPARAMAFATTEDIHSGYLVRRHRR